MVYAKTILCPKTNCKEDAHLDALTYGDTQLEYRCPKGHITYRAAR